MDDSLDSAPINAFGDDFFVVVVAVDGSVRIAPHELRAAGYRPGDLVRLYPRRETRTDEELLAESDARSHRNPGGVATDEEALAQAVQLARETRQRSSPQESHRKPQ